MLAAKASLAIRYDALGEGESNTELAFANRGKIENRLKQLEKQQVCLNLCFVSVITCLGCLISVSLKSACIF